MTQVNLWDTVEKMVQEQCPNFMRLYLNPRVAQACYLLARYVDERWPGCSELHPSFLANSGEEALSGAIKLARFNLLCERGECESDPTVLIIDPDSVWIDFSEVQIPSLGEHLALLPAVDHCQTCDEALLDRVCTADIVVVAYETLRALSRELIEAISQRSINIVCITAEDFWQRQESESPMISRMRAPDIVTFDHSFTGRAVAFGAFTAKPSLYEPWMKRNFSTFHSTTFQPNTITTLHFVRCIEAGDPAFFARYRHDLEEIAKKPEVCKKWFSRLFSPSLLKLFKLANVEVSEVRATGHYVHFGKRRVFDGVAGVASSVTGHNPPAFLQQRSVCPPLEMMVKEVSLRLHQLTQFPEHLPATSGGAAGELALKLGLASQYPRRHVIALEGGFGGKTLVALTGTSKPFYKQHLGSLYPYVTYINPFADDACAQFDVACRANPIAVVQLELIQGVGGVREVPHGLLSHIQQRRNEFGYYIFVDEIQTGMFRTGSFLRCEAVPLSPDLVTIGKAASDMMIPMAMTLYSEEIRERLERRGSDLPRRQRARASYALGYCALLGVLTAGMDSNLSDVVRRKGEFLRKRLQDALSDIPLVKDVRGSGFLSGIELGTPGWPLSLLKKKAYPLYLLRLLHVKQFPLLVGFCQYETNVLKLTPPLSTTEAEIEQIALTLREVLSQPSWQVALAGLRSMVGAKLR